MSTIGYYICVPFAWLVRLFYNLTNSYGVALILFTLVIKLIMLPFQMKSKKSMMRMSRVSGQMQDIAEALCQKPGQAAGGNAEALRRGGRQSHERMPLELSPLADPDGAVLHHPSAHHPLHDALQGCAANRGAVRCGCRR